MQAEDDGPCQRQGLNETLALCSPISAIILRQVCCTRPDGETRTLAPGSNAPDSTSGAGMPRTARLSPLRPWGRSGAQQRTAAGDQGTPQQQRPRFLLQPLRERKRACTLERPVGGGGCRSVQALLRSGRYTDTGRYPARVACVLTGGLNSLHAPQPAMVLMRYGDSPGDQRGTHFLPYVFPLSTV